MRICCQACVLDHGRYSMSAGVSSTWAIFPQGLTGRAPPAPGGGVQVGSSTATFIMNQLATWSQKYSPRVTSL